MGLKSMHREQQSENIQSSTQDNSLVAQLSQRIEELQSEREQDSSLIGQQSQKIEELEKQVSSLQSQAEELQAQKKKYLQEHLDLKRTIQKKDFQLSEALEQAENWKKQAQSRPDQSQQLAEMQSQISELSSANSKLMSELQKKSEIIVQLNEKEEIYNKSDLIRQENEKLKRENSNLQRSEQNAKREAEATVSAVKDRYAEKERELAHTQYEAESTRIEVEALKKRQNQLIKDKAKEMYQSKEKSLISAYKGKETALEGAFFGSLAYGVLVTVLTAIDSRAFVSDFKTFFLTVWNWATAYIDFALDGAKWASQLGDMIPQEIVAFIVHWLVLIVVLLLLVGGMGALLCFGVVKLIELYVEELEFADNLSLLVFLVSLALSIFFADEIRAFLPINLLLLNILVHVIYSFIRWYVKGCRQNRGYY